MALGVLVVVVYALATRPNLLAGDQAEYDLQGRFFDDGKLWWSTVITGVPHPTAWKSPIYPAWVGFWYEVLGPSPTKVALVQGFLLAPLTVFLTWLLARRWFGLRTAIASAFVIALFPLSWEFFGLLYSEALAIPLTLLALLLALRSEPPSLGHAALTGGVIGVLILVRPTSFFVFAGIVVAWVIVGGLRRGAGLSAVAVGCAVLVVAPWTIRNAIELDEFVPISIQDAAAYGTFNDEAASDPDYPYAWRPFPDGLAADLERDPPAGEVEFRSLLQDRAREYIQDHPESIPLAFFWNGLSRTWDVRRPARALDEVPFEGRSRLVTTVGLGAYYALLPLALLGLWRLRRRREIALPIIALALGLSVVFTIQSGTRYRAPLEPVIVILACSTLAGGLGRRTQDESSLPPPGTA